ncbi:cytokine receptor common subunit gamma isoform X2 [Rhineura floridana]|uniref:cytokine receptor common subunit gamma isoform X2 n=1 Tax=Rhineura floridana TaxID=261503 RepID=UPI002AC83E1C|nr:cytokine receptor common subunit gamma isoform X2 [Rhineura floridana]
MEASKVQKMLPVLLLLFLGPGEQTAGSSQTQGLECIVFNEEYMTCDWGSRQKPTANYSLYYWYDIHEAPQECEHYIQSDGINTGCWFSDVDLDYYFNAYISVNHSRNSSVLEQHVLLQHRVKPSPPINLSIQNMSNNQLLLTWGSSKIPHHCLEHIVKYKSNKDTDWMEQKTQVMKFNLVSVDPEKFYTFFVRSKMSESCASTNLWSDEAGPVTWGKNATTKGSANEVQSMYFWIQSILIPVGSLFLLLFMVLALMRMERNGLEFPRMPWRVSSPTTVRVSAASVSCSLVGAICLCAMIPWARLEGWLASLESPLPRSTPSRFCGTATCGQSILVAPMSVGQ